MRPMLAKDVSPQYLGNYFDIHEFISRVRTQVRELLIQRVKSLRAVVHRGSVSWSFISCHGQ